MTAPAVSPLRGKASLPVVLRQPQPSARLVEATGLLEAALWSLQPDRGAVLRLLKKGERERLSLVDLIHYYRQLLSPIEPLLEANCVRNRYTHAADRHQMPPMVDELESAAATMVSRVEQLLPHLSEEARGLVLADPHAGPVSITVTEALRLERAPARMAALVTRLDAMLAMVDQEENQAGYDLADGAERASARQRFERHRGLFRPVAQAGLREALKVAEALQCEPVSESKEHHQRAKFSRCERTLVEAVHAVEARLGLPMEQIVDEPVVEELAIEEATPVVVEAEAETQPELAPEPEPAVAVTTVRVPVSTARLLWRSALATGVVLTMLTGALSFHAVEAVAPAPQRHAVRMPAGLVHWVRPEMTAEAAKAGVRGEVELRVETDAAGSVIAASVVRSLGRGLEANAIGAVSQWRFEGGARTLLVKVAF